MDRKTSSGRKKRVTSGGGNAKRRGSGTGSGPVGRKDKYSGRRKSGSSYSSGSQGSSGSSGGSSGGGSRSILSGLFGGGGKKSSMLKTIIIIIIIVVIGYFVIKSCSGNDAPADDLSAERGKQDGAGEEETKPVSEGQSVPAKDVGGPAEKTTDEVAANGSSAKDDSMVVIDKADDQAVSKATKPSS